MDFNFFPQAYGLFSVIVLIKSITLIAIGFYIVFTFVVFTQVKVMTQILYLPNAETLLKTISIINIALAISLFVGAFAIL